MFLEEERMKNRGIAFMLVALLLVAASVQCTAGMAVQMVANEPNEAIDDEFTEWSMEKPSGIADSFIQTKIEYRFRTKQFSSATTDSLAEDWTLYEITTQWGPYGDWSPWSPNAITASESVQVETATIYGYYHYACTNCGKRWPRYGSCWTRAGGCGATTTDNFTTFWSDVSWEEAAFQYWNYDIIAKDQYYTDCFDDGIWYRWTTNGQPQKGYRYRVRNLEVIYQYYRWTQWSDWSDVPVVAGDTVETETRTLYRHLRTEFCGHDYRYIDNCDGTHSRVCQVCGNVEIRGEAHNFSNGLCVCGAMRPVRVISRNVPYTVRDNVVTVNNTKACKVGYWDNAAQMYVEIPCAANDDGCYCFTAPDGIMELLLVVIGDVDGNGLLEEADNDLLAQGLLPWDCTDYKELDVIQRFATDVNSNGKLNAADRLLIARAVLPEGCADHASFVWNT